MLLVFVRYDTQEAVIRVFRSHRADGAVLRHQRLHPEISPGNVVFLQINQNRFALKVHGYPSKKIIVYKPVINRTGHMAVL